MQIIKSESNVLSEQELKTLSDILIKLEIDMTNNCNNCQYLNNCSILDCQFSNY